MIFSTKYSKKHTINGRAFCTLLDLKTVTLLLQQAIVCAGICYQLETKLTFTARVGRVTQTVNVFKCQR